MLWYTIRLHLYMTSSSFTDLPYVRRVRFPYAGALSSCNIYSIYNTCGNNMYRMHTSRAQILVISLYVFTRVAHQIQFPVARDPRENRKISHRTGSASALLRVCLFVIRRPRATDTWAGPAARLRWCDCGGVIRSVGFEWRPSPTHR